MAVGNISGFHSHRFTAFVIASIATASTLVKGEIDSNYYYGKYANPNYVYKHYWATATNVSKFEKLYVKYGGCAWSRSTTMENYGNCGQYSSSEDEWWGSMGECRASNVAYSLYGILKGDASIWRGSACSKSTFINSFFTMDGLYNFVEASKGKVSDTYNYPYCSEYSGNDDWNNWRRLSNSGSGDGEVDAYSTMGCSSSGRFVWDVFNGDTCFGANYLYTADPLYDFNESLENHMQCKLIFKKGHVDFAFAVIQSDVSYNGGIQRLLSRSAWGFIDV
eukprot:CAMPEP_0113327612 /NCGR_PEP_ID=MMETSP0010_2-20120614/19413_1 /TAXON_ID=216773 ORGANISM="Corethron hystrix, Strain 308" /NCGR_SAMPLE_ID=MMETSP0010_2 /ASSEMBLY_ACC=CAM_ASM_000155 /LENGTH=277 /DNA_ID=CAMNT_0000188553 /DNA_START=66 /DNA_END=899 /DNA_ORIENTATION=- /assembly_acc=CAM_ASM_000155